MKVYVIRDSTFTLSQGQPASDVLSYEGFAKRYLAEFDEVVLVGRLFAKEDPASRPAVGPGVTFLALPGYRGPVGFLRSLPEILRVVFRSLHRDAAYILRVPTTVPSLYALLLHLRGQPFAVEVAADPRDSYSRKALNNSVLAPAFQALFVSLMRWQCRAAAVSAYVTRDALQRRYPPRSSETSFAFTSIDLTPETYSDGPRRADTFDMGRPRLVLIGNMQKSWKGHDVLLRAMKILKDRGRDLRLTVVGYGENQPLYAQMAQDMGLDVHFTGKLQNGAPVREVLDQGDLFVLPSRQEGLPRALLEAMARGLPAIATRVGGTPELLDDDCLAPPDDPESLAARIDEALASPEELARRAAVNFATAQRYNVTEVTKARLAFYRQIKVCVEQRR
jgi:glycosyltransferase involved in cell wall biosynthesis